MNGPVMFFSLAISVGAMLLFALLPAFELARTPLSGVLQEMLFETNAFDPWTFIAVGVMLASFALLACLVPALRASRINPLEALRVE